MCILMGDDRRWQLVVVTGKDAPIAPEKRDPAGGFESLQCRQRAACQTILYFFEYSQLYSMIEFSKFKPQKQTNKHMLKH